MAPRIVYFVHDLSDPAVHRRVHMMQLGGALTTVVGFRRSNDPVRIMHAAEIVDLGRTHDARLMKRSAAVALALANLDRIASYVREADLIIARNLEMLVLATPARRRYSKSAKLIFECLDIHKLLLSNGVAGQMLRILETRLWRSVDLLLTSSPAFVDNYFLPRGYEGPIKLVENKVLLQGRASQVEDYGFSTLPWRIGWFGMLRCQRSLEALGQLAAALGGLVHIVIRGRPSRAVFPDFAAAVAQHRFIRFEGQYSPADLGAIYADVHFSWAIDYYEEGLNSSWLLPNRLYESGLHGVIPIALSNVATGRWLSERGIGLVVQDPPVAQLIDVFRGLDPDIYRCLKARVITRPPGDFSITGSECKELVDELTKA